jgi:hypothetical protein
LCEIWLGPKNLHLHIAGKAQNHENHLLCTATGKDSSCDIQIGFIVEPMKGFVVRFLLAFTLFAAATLAVANPFKSKIIIGTDSTFVIAVPNDHFLKITNFTQVGGTDRGVVEVTLSGDTENVGTVNILTATRIDLSTGANSQNFPEIASRVVVAGPATVSVRPVTGATLFISYQKELNNGGGGGESASPTPLPIFSATPGVTPTPTGTAFPFPTPTPP